MAKPKVRYELDPHNRLVIGSGRTRRVVEGYFKNESGKLVYHAKASGDNPQQLKLDGKWQLNKKNHLELVLNKWGQQIAGDKLNLKAALISLQGHKVVFAVNSRQDSRISIYTISLEGSWAVDKQNRLSFSIGKNAKTGSLLFKTGWKIKDNQITIEFGPKEKLSSVKLSGHWDICERNQLTYILETKPDTLIFRTGLARAIQKGRQSRLECELKIGRKKTKVSLIGTWKISRRFGLLFEIPYSEGTMPVIFAAQVELTPENQFQIKLKNEQGGHLGMEFSLHRQFLHGAVAFIKWLENRKHRTVEVGAGFSW